MGSGFSNSVPNASISGILPTKRSPPQAKILFFLFYDYLKHSSTNSKNHSVFPHETCRTNCQEKADELFVIFYCLSITNLHEFHVFIMRHVDFSLIISWFPFSQFNQSYCLLDLKNLFLTHVLEETLLVFSEFIILVKSTM